MRITLAGALAGVLMLAGQAAYAAPITTLFNTGMAADRSLLADGTLGDPHYTLTTVPLTSTSTIRVITEASGYPIGPYMGDNLQSRWIGPNNTPDVDGPAGTYVYRTTFSLAGLNHATASISGLWATDNEGLNIYLNGQARNFQSASYGFFSPFVLNSGFLPGLNTIEFHVNNGGGPTALRVQMNGTADPIRDPDPDPDPAPEPATLAILGAGLAGVALRRRTRP
ncbi:hypothetical protein TBR22_A11260 [Luteitalea sp. TBR-22]|uniref:PEP-CTERM sorting domain-containing protein n=1 Tax=Luteitalea sp. TBR-22 TaxID=2802971 RepID=UPI001AF15CC7|nr:PEP-CTERM sorting domain-containing protein [Luteitalea sp. TBR-22]BCS31923.1 hypothetical protein TBR22_A11260 [Luteitalea sp. TBR-22]